MFSIPQIRTNAPGQSVIVNAPSLIWLITLLILYKPDISYRTKQNQSNIFCINLTFLIEPNKIKAKLRNCQRQFFLDGSPHHLHRNYQTAVRYNCVICQKIDSWELCSTLPTLYKTSTFLPESKQNQKWSCVSVPQKTSHHLLQHQTT